MTDSGEEFDVVPLPVSLTPDVPRTVRVPAKAAARLRARRALVVTTPAPAESAAPLTEAGSYVALSANMRSPNSD